MSSTISRKLLLYAYEKYTEEILEIIVFVENQKSDCHPRKLRKKIRLRLKLQKREYIYYI